MRHFSSSGPVDAELHYALGRPWLVERCVEQLVGRPDKGGHFFTIHAPRQTGKTWLMHRAVEQIRQQHGDRFLVGVLSLQGLMADQDPDEVFLRSVGPRLGESLMLAEPTFDGWDDWLRLFRRVGSPFDRPVILLVDEFDNLTRTVIDRLVGLFRQMYLSRDAYLLHGLALIGVRAVLGVDSPRGSPFNIQRSLQVPNFSRGEVEDLFGQYQAESGQAIEPVVVEQVYETVRGQPGLTCWRTCSRGSASMPRRCCSGTSSTLSGCARVVGTHFAINRCVPTSSCPRRSATSISTAGCSRRWAVSA